jgi:hypothetical protein
VQDRGLGPPDSHEHMFASRADRKLGKPLDR